MVPDPITRKCGELGSDAKFVKAVKDFNENEFPKHYWTGWQEAEDVFNPLSSDMKDILRNLALNKSPTQKMDQSIECLKALRLVAPDAAQRLKIVKPNFGAWIILNYSWRGIIKRPYYRIGHGYQQAITTGSTRRTGTLVFWAFVLLCIPIAIMLSPLLNLFDQLQTLVITSRVDKSIDPFRNLAIYLVIFIVVLLLVSRFGRNSNGGSFLFILSIPSVVALTMFWLGFPTRIVILFVTSAILDLLALQLLFRAHQTLPTTPDHFENKKLRKLLVDTIKPETWKDMTAWPELKIILMVFLSLTGFLFFGTLLAPREVSLPVLAQLSQNLLVAPAWLSYRDEGTVLVAIRNDSARLVSGTILLEPEVNNLISIVPSDKESCSPRCSWGPLGLTADRSQGRASTQSSEFVPGSEYTILEWRLHTAPRRVLPSESAWQLRVSYCTHVLDTSQSPQCDEQRVSINKIRIGFRMWGLLDEQPLVNVMSVIFGLVYAIVQIWIGNLFIVKSG